MTLVGNSSGYCIQQYTTTSQVKLPLINKMPRYRRENRAMPLYISICIEFYNGIVWFLCHSTAFL